MNLDQLRPKVIGRLVNATGIVMFCLVAVAYFTFVIAPFETHLERKTNRIASLNTKYSKHGTLESEKCGLGIESDELTATLDRWQRRVPESSQVDQFLNQVSQLAKKNDIEILDFRPGDSQIEREFSRLDIQLNTSATYQNYCRFLEALENSERLNLIRNMSVTAVGEVCQFSMTVTIFHRTTSPDSRLTSASR